jgi:hypothetical protein
MPKFAFVIFIFSLIPFTANSFELFGPSNFDECIFQNMKGVKSDTAANAIIYACRKKFPNKIEQPSINIRDGYPRIDLWNKTPKEDILLQFSAKAPRNNGYGGTVLSVTNKSSIDIMSVYIGTIKNGNSCERLKENYDEIYECKGNISANTTNEVTCAALLKKGWCVVGVKGGYQTDLDAFFKARGYQ